ncbi:hypothetical protein VV7356_03185 [Vibrio vulnificus]|uniref:terminase large subunit domain-containing protein n=2 Tax=Vibrionaceae TaxID=641 RepID=UPI0003487703|nr:MULTISPECIES: terminase family protein [Vibrio]EWS67489.1 hypothetical protein Y702_20410 [Vibrio vulnificus BAA87]NHE85701.1 hypothetical protein [Vibrio vulnificus]POC53916.1 hypothetical protein CRN45_04300 [Vibrio vulnificus]POC63960.1 hypothetical protein CRN44_10360 [Vibrio vulnificus]
MPTTATTKKRADRRAVERVERKEKKKASKSKAFDVEAFKEEKKASGAAWFPLPGSQEIFLMMGQLATLIREVLYHGGRGIGKSELLIADFLQHVDKGWGTEWNGIIIRREFKNLSDLVKKSKTIIPKVFPDAKFVGGAENKWTFADGETLQFIYVKRDEDYDGWHGKEFQFIAWDELAVFPTAFLYESFKSLLRTSFQPTTRQPNMPPLQIRAATNPWGAGAYWVYERFIKDKVAGEIEFNKKNGKPWLTAVFGSVYENLFINEEYIQDLEDIKDPQKRAAWLEGDWEAAMRSANTFFAPVWDEDSHVIEPFVVPEAWYVDRVFDWGQSTPFAHLIVAKADGHTPAYLQDGTLFCPPEGSLIFLAENYGVYIDEQGKSHDNKGLNLSARQCARRAKTFEESLMLTWLREHDFIHAGAADNQIWNGKNVNDDEFKTVGDIFEEEGITFTMSDKSPYSRVTGAQLVFEYLSSTKEYCDLKASGELEKIDAKMREKIETPQMYFTTLCPNTIKFMPRLERDPAMPDAVAKGANDHLYDAVKYKALDKEQTAFAL